MGFLEISGAEFGRGDLRRNGKHGYARPLTIEQPIDEVQIARSTASGADRKLSCQVRLGTGRKGRNLLVPHMNPLDLSLAADRIGQPIQAIAHDAIYPFHASCSEGFCKLICYGRHDLALSREQRTWYRLLTSKARVAWF